MSDELKQISTEELQNRIDDPRLKIIDVRSADAYNGWPLQGESRSGHIPGARNMPVKWIEYIDWIEIVVSKEILPEDELVIYGYDRESITKVAGMFVKTGYSNVHIYTDFTTGWVADPELPLRQLPRYQQLVPASWVHELAVDQKDPESGRPLSESDRNYVICHVHYRNRDDYEQGHIPGAVALDTNTLEDPTTWNRRSPEELEQALKDLGINRDSTVIVYGRFSHPNNEDPYPGSSAGHLGAFRCAFLMMYAGVGDVRVLNGGMQSWQDEGYPLTSAEPEITPAAEFGTDIPGNPHLVTDLPQAEKILQSSDKNLVSVRSWSEFIGEVSGYNYIEKKGRIPGAVFADCGSDAYHMENYRNLDHTTREFQEIERKWTEAGITPDKHNAFYCGTGWRGSEAFFNAWLLGWSDISVFDGGWFEWSNSGKPCETGIPETV